MSFNVSEIKAMLNFDGARPSLFEINITNPASTTGDQKLRFMAKAASIPSSTMSAIEVPYFGRKIKVSGSRNYENWNVTIINDEDFSVRSAMEAWSSQINSARTNVRTIAGDYRSMADVIQYGKRGDILRAYKFVNIFPLNISPIELAWENADSIEEYQIEFAYDYWQVSDPEIVE